MSVDDPLDPDLIRANLRTKRIGRKVLVYEHTASTNDVAAEYAKNADNDGLVVFAEAQTAGRGRTGAKWQSRCGESLLFSFALIGSQVGSELLSLACAVAVAEAVGRAARIKWPNDVVIDGRKVAGILLESRRTASVSPAGTSDPWPAAGGSGHESQATSSKARVTSHGSRVTSIIGIGINCHQAMEDFPPDLRATATSLDLASGTRCRRVTVAKRVLTSLDQWLRTAERDPARVIDTWGRLSTQLNQRVTLSYNDKRFAGNCIGVDPQKGLILQLDRGGVRIFDAAHTHIVK